MKTSMMIPAILACALSAPFVSVVSAQERTAPAKPAMSMGKDAPMSQMQEKMKAMQAQMDKLHKTTDPKERQKLMHEHMQAMQENMKAMHSMGGPMMAGMMGSKPGTKGPGAMGGDPKQQQEMLGQRMDMMQMMMEQMLQHDHAMESMPAK